MGSKNDRKRLRAATSDSGSEDEKVPPVFDKFFVIESAEQGKTFAKTSPFLIEKTLFSTIGNTNNVKILKDGKLLVEILREKQAKNLQKLESFCDIKCRHQMQNYTTQDVEHFKRYHKRQASVLLLGGRDQRKSVLPGRYTR